jgi:hypothetical protein
MVGIEQNEWVPYFDNKFLFQYPKIKTNRKGEVESLKSFFRRQVFPRTWYKRIPFCLLQLAAEETYLYLGASRKNTETIICN